MTTHFENTARITALLKTPEPDRLRTIRLTLDDTEPSMSECDDMCREVVTLMREATEDSDLYSLVGLAARLLDGSLSVPERAELESCSLLLLSCFRPYRPANPSGLELFEQAIWQQLADALNNSIH